MEITERWKNRAISFWENGAVIRKSVQFLELFQDCYFGPSLAGPQLINGATLLGLPSESGVGPSNMSPRPYSVCTSHLGLPSTCAIGPIILARGRCLIGAIHWAFPVFGHQAQISSANWTRLWAHVTGPKLHSHLDKPRWMAPISVCGPAFMAQFAVQEQFQKLHRFPNFAATFSQNEIARFFQRSVISKITYLIN